MIRNDNTINVEVIGTITIFNENGNKKESVPISLNINYENVDSDLTVSMPINVTFLPPITPMKEFSLPNGSILPIRFTARNRSTYEFVYDETVNVSITNSTGSLIADFAYGTGGSNVNINSADEQYVVNFNSMNYALKIGESYAVTVTFGGQDALKGYAITYFSVVDGIPPTTTATISGTPGNNGWYTSDVQVNLTAADNEDGSGIYKTEYSFDNATWIEYNAEFLITSEGTTTIYYRSIDNAGNVESAKNQKIKIDRTPPEASIRFNITSKDLMLYNNETGNQASYIKIPIKKGKDGKEMPDDDGDVGWELRQYTLNDLASNSLVLVLEHKKEGNEAKVKVLSTQYNGGKVLKEIKNKMQAQYSEERKGALKELQQDIEVKKQFNAEAKYSAQKGKTEIKVDIEGQKEKKETRKGIVILELLTDKGGLKLRY